MNIETIERVARHAWPALEELDTEIGLLRCAAGVSRRANSLTLGPEVIPDAHFAAQTAEEFFFSRGLPAVVRIADWYNSAPSSLMALDCYLDENQYQYQANTRVLVKSLADCSVNPAEESLSIRESELCHWLQCWHSFSGHPAAHFQIHRMMLSRITGSRLSALGYMKSEEAEPAPLCCGLGVVSHGVLAVYGVATAEGHRGSGFGRQLMEQILAWGAAQGAAYAFLQVEATNQPALALYEKLGFRAFYSYWYRVKPLQRGNRL